MEFLYINLEKDTDRNEDMKELLKDFSYTRISAIKHDYGPLGASQSHIKALEYAIEKNWNSVCIMEDDLVWNQREKNWLILQDLLKKPFDVIMLCGVLVNYNKETYKLKQSNCAAGYIVHKNYYKTLLENFKDGYQKFSKDYYRPIMKCLWNKNGYDIRRPSLSHLYRVDTYWHSLQEKDNWFIIPLFISKPNISNTEKKYRDYSHIFLK